MNGTEKIRLYHYKHWVSAGLRISFWVVFVLLAGTRTSSADSVATLLGNYSISQLVRMDLETGQVRLHYVVDMAAIPALKTLHLADANDDGSTSTDERDSYLRSILPELAKNLNLSIDGQAIELRLGAMTSTLPPEQGGFSLRFDADFVGPLAASGATPHQLSFRNANYADQFGWHEIVVVAGAEVTAYDTNAVSTSATDNLNVNPEALPPGGPLDEREVHVSFSAQAPASVQNRLQPRAGYPPGSALAGDARSAAARENPATPGTDKRDFFTRSTDRLVNLISAPLLSPTTMLVALLVALLLGAVHALSPGHGKTVVGAYLIGSRGTPRHAAFLGFTVTVTHTLGVFVLGFATLFASRYFVPERIFPILTFVSGALVVVIGGSLLTRRIRQMWHERKGHANLVLPSGAIEPGLGAMMFPGAHPHAGVAPVNDHHADDRPDHGNAVGMHSHGGVMHSHMPPGSDDEPITWRSLLSLGISGGLLPCPSALVLLLAAVALHRTGFGLVLVVAFSLGLAITLTAIGMMFLYAKHLLRGPVKAHRLLEWLPIGSAAVITILGLGICYGVVATTL